MGIASTPGDLSGEDSVNVLTGLSKKSTLKLCKVSQGANYVSIDIWLCSHDGLADTENVKRKLCDYIALVARLVQYFFNGLIRILHRKAFYAAVRYSIQEQNYLIELHLSIVPPFLTNHNLSALRLFYD